jgi:hypothetical protein
MLHCRRVYLLVTDTDSDPTAGWFDVLYISTVDVFVVTVELRLCEFTACGARAQVPDTVV